MDFGKIVCHQRVFYCNTYFNYTTHERNNLTKNVKFIKDDTAIARNTLVSKILALLAKQLQCPKSITSGEGCPRLSVTHLYKAGLP